MGVGLQKLEELMPAVLEGDSEIYLTERGFDFEAVGTWCGLLARSAVESLVLKMDDPRYQELGTAFTTTALCAFEMGVRSKPAEVPA